MRVRFLLLLLFNFSLFSCGVEVKDNVYSFIDDNATDLTKKIEIDIKSLYMSPSKIKVNLFDVYHGLKNETKVLYCYPQNFENKVLYEDKKSYNLEDKKCILEVYNTTDVYLNGEKLKDKNVYFELDKENYVSDLSSYDKVFYINFLFDKAKVNMKIKEENGVVVDIPLNITCGETKILKENNLKVSLMCNNSTFDFDVKDLVNDNITIKADLNIIYPYTYYYPDLNISKVKLVDSAGTQLSLGNFDFKDIDIDGKKEYEKEYSLNITEKETQKVDLKLFVNDERKYFNKINIKVK